MPTTPMCSPSTSCNVVDEVQNIRVTLDNVGLRFVPVFGAEDAVQASGHLDKLYADALPMGVTLVATASLTAAATFAERDPQCFGEKTARVILMSGARKRESRRECQDWLEPDPDAQNNRLDMEAATKLFQIAQEL